MKLLFTTCFYNRPEISKLYLLGLERLKKIHDFDLLVCCSDKASAELCKKEDVKYFIHENLPLGEKHNVLFKKCLEYDFDFLIHSGDDDILTDKGFLRLLGAMKEHKYIVHDTLYFYSIIEDIMIKHKAMQPMGAFRAFRRDILEGNATFVLGHFRQDVKIGNKVYNEGCKYWIPNKLYHHYNSMALLAYEGEKFELYDNSLNSGLDFSSHSTLIEQGVEPYLIDDCEIIDVKSNQNISNFNKLLLRSEQVDKNEVFSSLSDEEKNYLKSCKIVKC